jgi:hypothetical protein
MKTTTVRFDHASWAEIERYSQRLGIAHAAFIRDAVIERLARLDNNDRLARVEQRVDDLAWQMGVAARTLKRVATRIGLVHDVSEVGPGLRRPRGVKGNGGRARLSDQVRKAAGEVDPGDLV